MAAFSEGSQSQRFNFPALQLNQLGYRGENTDFLLEMGARIAFQATTTIRSEFRLEFDPTIHCFIEVLFDAIRDFCFL